MTPDQVPYPPTPATVPAGYLSVPPSYKQRVVFVLLNLIVFWALYLGLFGLCLVSLVKLPDWFGDTRRFGHATPGHVAPTDATALPPALFRTVAQTKPEGASAHGGNDAVSYSLSPSNNYEGNQVNIQQNYTPNYQYSYNYNRRGSDWNWPMIICYIVALVMIPFLGKAFFKQSGFKADGLILLKRKDEPVLFAFLEKVAREANAPMPHKVYLSSDVNASVFYNSTLLSLFWPTKKNLLIGVGLVNNLNTSEFKAVMAHEYGHFSQRSMKLGSYVYQVNRVVWDVVFARDWFDKALDAMKQIDFRLTILAFGIQGFVWCLRQVLRFLYLGVNLANSRLSQEMEYNADRVASTVAGTDAIVQALRHLHQADDALNDSLNRLGNLAQTKVFTKNIFAHQRAAAQRMRAEAEPNGLPVGPAEFVFTAEQNEIPHMYASHPTNFQREHHLKKSGYLGVELQHEPCRSLFQNIEAYEVKFSAQMNAQHRMYKENPSILEAEEMEARIAADHREAKLDPKYHGIYDDRYLLLPNFDAIIAETPLSVQEIRTQYPSLWPETLAEYPKRVLALRKEQQALLAPLQAGQKVRKLNFRGTEYAVKDINKAIDILSAEQKAMYDAMSTPDEPVLRLHLSLVRHLPVGDAELLERYRFLHLLGSISMNLHDLQHRLNEQVDSIQKNNQVGDTHVEKIQKIHKAALLVLDRTNQITLPRLENIPKGKLLKEYLTDGTFPPAPGSNEYFGRRVDELYQKFSSIFFHSNYLYAKALGQLLAYQDSLAQQFLAQPEGAETVEETV